MAVARVLTWEAHMRKLFLVALATSLFMALGAGSALATGGGGGGKGSGKPCPPASPGGQEKPPDSAPNCGKGKGGGKPGNGGGNPGDGCKPKKPNCPPKDDCKKDPKKCLPADNCENADLVVFRNARIICVYLGDKAPLVEQECEDALIALPVDNLVGVCVFLPPDTDGDGGGTGGLPDLPDLPGLPKS